MHKLRVMHNLKRRIEELEKAALVLRRDREAKAERALWNLEPHQMELVINSVGAEIEGRPLNEAESAARQAYILALEAECRRSPPSSNRFVPPPSPVLEKFLRILVAQLFSEEAFKLTARGERKQKEERLTEAELAIEEVPFVGAASAPTRRLLSREGGGEGGK